MKRPILAHPSVDDDLVEAARYYAAIDPDLAEDLLTRVEDAKRRIAATPKMHRIIWRDVRRTLVGRFDYGVFYRVLADHVQVLAVYHMKRDPAGWQQRV